MTKRVKMKSTRELELEDEVARLTSKLRDATDDVPARAASALETIASELSSIRQLFEPIMLIANVALEETLGETITEPLLREVFREAIVTAGDPKLATLRAAAKRAVNREKKS